MYDENFNEKISINMMNVNKKKNFVLKSNLSAQSAIIELLITS